MHFRVRVDHRFLDFRTLTVPPIFPLPFPRLSLSTLSLSVDSAGGFAYAFWRRKAPRVKEGVEQKRAMSIRAVELEIRKVEAEIERVNVEITETNNKMGDVGNDDSALQKFLRREKGQLRTEKEQLRTEKLRAERARERGIALTSRDLTPPRLPPLNVLNPLSL